MNLSKNNLHIINTKHVDVPQGKIFELPEKVLQFGTGVLLRALPDYFIDKANKQGIFNGRIIVVKSTDSDSSAFDNQDGLYTICVRGIENGNIVNENIINSSISRVLSAKSEWYKILACAANPEMKVIISNTTEVGIQLVDDKIENTPPTSFPGKLLAFLFERYKIFKGDQNSGLVIIPTELITDNGSQLKNIILHLAKNNNADQAFIDWINNCNTFCNSLVDRIVPGKPGNADKKEIENQLGYTDELLCMSEVFRLWAIEAHENLKEILSFAKVDAGVVIQPDITLFKELKLRLLNGTHTFNCGLAFLSGFDITRDAIKDRVFSQFAKRLMYNEISKSIPYTISTEMKEDFANKVFERFCNPFINHQWQSITVQVTSKMKMRNIPLLKRWYDLSNVVPMYMATGFAGYLLYMKIIKKDGDIYFGMRKNEYYEIKDDAAPYFYTLWQNINVDDVVKTVMSNKNLWEIDLTTLPQFYDMVCWQLKNMMESGVLQTITNLVTKKEIVHEG